MQRTRQYLVFVFVMFLFLSLIGRLFYLQVLRMDRFTSLASNQHNRVLKIEPRRGTIFDRFMEPLAINLDVPSIYSDPRYLEDKELAARELSRILGLNEESLLGKINKGKAFVWIKRKVSAEEADGVRELGLKGVYFLDESKRSYADSELAAHLLGFVNIDNKGLEGLELLLDDELRGKPGWRHLVRDAKRRTVEYDEAESIPAENGLNVVLTVDSVIQYIVEEELEKMSDKFNASGASAIVMDPHSGRILAMANYPGYDLYEFSETPKDLMKNASVANVFEPGSVFKVFTAACVLNEGLVDLNDKFDCENGEWPVAGRVLHDYHAYDTITFKEVISHSSNIGTVKAAQKAGANKLYEYIKMFGFGSKTGIDLPGEVGGISRHPKIWSRSDITTIPIGQGIAVTPLQLASGLSVIANGGRLMKPYIIEKIITLDGSVHEEFDPVVVREVISEETCDKMKDVMESVVQEGTGRRARSKKFSVCGKTGTAQMVNPAGGYYQNKYYATFIGFAPKENPSVVIVVSAKDPHPIHFGGSVAGPAFKRIAERTVQYMGSNEAAEKVDNLR